MQGPRALMAIANSNNKFTMDDCKNNAQKIHSREKTSWMKWDLCNAMCYKVYADMRSPLFPWFTIALCKDFDCLSKSLKLSNLIFKLDSIYSIIPFTLWAGIQNDEVDSYSSFIFCNLPALLCGMLNIVCNNNGWK